MDPVLFGPYRLDELIGRGRTGEVYQAFDTERGRMVALKRLPVALGTDAEFLARFRREVATAARLQSLHIVPIHDYGDIENRLFIDMRLVVGLDLGRLLANQGALAPTRAVEILAQVASALDDAHVQGVTHCDVKPSNVLLTPDDFAYLTDFGVARALAASTTLTVTGATVGTLAYMAPERFLGQTEDQLADIYALTCVLHESLTGRPPFEGAGLSALRYAHVHLAPPPASQQRPDIPAALDEVIARGMAKDPIQRFASAGQLARAARDAVHTPTTATFLNTTTPPQPCPVDTAQAPKPLPALPDGHASTIDRRQSRRWLLLAIATALAIAIAITAFLSLNRPSSIVNAGTGAAGLVLSTSQVKIGNSYLATASGFLPGENVQFSWTGLSNGVIGVFRADSVGNASTGVWEGASPGNYTIIVTGLTSGRTASAKLQVVGG